jgi:hypothetical protein
MAIGLLFLVLAPQGRDAFLQAKWASQVPASFHNAEFHFRSRLAFRHVFSRSALFPRNADQ